MALNFEKLCRFCMVQDDKLLPIFENGENIMERIMIIIPNLQVSDCRIVGEVSQTNVFKLVRCRTFEMKHCSECYFPCFPYQTVITGHEFTHIHMKYCK
jgi:hypothetical protein